ncbi:adenosylcobalamin-dependent ribonucleoside-diphosphate reductase [Candidatus Woesebacteria bacterium]|nr:MAG: adenosylcobalamin-dependent ribonucleoside-diphosphate reductase [Candidatus Woesebacteria bacterium]
MTEVLIQQTIKKVSSANGHSRLSKAALQNGGKFFQEGENATKLEGIREKLFLDRYSLKDKDGNSLEKYPEQSWRRMSWAIAQTEKGAKNKRVWEEKFYNAMQDFKFVPAGRIWCSAGTGTKATMINCYVIPSPEDTRAGIITTLSQMTEISARGGGVGFNLSTLRPRGSYLKKVNGTSSGAVSWANLYSVAAHDIIQQGGTRRGALMLMLWDWHPDIEEFITVKKKEGKILGANLSVCISNAFMKAVKEDGNWDLKFPDTESEKYREVWDGDFDKWVENDLPVKVYKTIKARDLWDLICQSAWESAEPGVVFMDRYNDMNNSWYYEKNIATNPCGEQGLPAWGVCNLSSINLAAFVENNKFDYDGFAEVIKVGVRFLDNAIDTEKYFYDEIEKVQKDERRIGLGTMGLADALIKMKVRYGSEESLVIIEKIFKLLRDVSYETSIDLALEKGSFPKLDKDKYLQSGFMKTMPVSIRNKIKKNGIRNAFLVTEAPTGKISLLSGVSSGIEPVFSFSYKQKDRLGERTMYHPIYQEWLDEHPDEKDVPEHFVVADDLTPEEHVSIQALIQHYTDSSISKTVNAPSTHSVEDVKKLYTLAFDLGCKGISYMRDGSREGTLIRDNKESNEEKSVDSAQEVKVVVWERPVKISGATYKLKTPVGTAFITVNRDNEGMPIELFINIGRAGSDVQAMAEALGRLISKTLKGNNHMTVKDRALMVVDQLSGIGGMRPVGFGKNRIMSLPDAVAKAIQMDMNVSDDKLIGDTSPNDVSDNQLSLTQAEIHLDKRADLCPACGNATLVNEMGCKTCHGCGYSEC